MSALVAGHVSAQRATLSDALDWWSTKSATSAVATRQEVAHFLAPLLDDTVQTKGDVPLAVFVGDFTWLDLDRDGRVELLATVSTSPRLTFNQFVVVARAGTTFGTQRVMTSNLETLDDVVRDFDGSGAPELLVPVEYAAGTGAHRIIWPAILALVDGKLTDVSSRHPSRYETVVSEVAADIAKLERALAGAANHEARSLTRELIAGRQMVLDRALRMTGRDVDAPSRRAAEWIQSPDPQLRRFALAVIAANPGPASAAQLQSLAAASDVNLRQAAEATLERLRAEGRIP